MKLISTLLALTLSLSAFGAYTPQSIKGQADSSKSNLINLQVPNKQATSTAANTYLIETGNKNLLTNPSFEHSTFDTGWTCTGAVVETTIRHHGLKSLKISPSGASFECYQDSTINASYMGGTNLTAMGRASSNFSGAKVCSRNDGTTSTTNCVNVNSNASFATPYAVPFIGSTTSNGVSITSAGVSVTGDIYLDDFDVSPTVLNTQIQLQTQTTKFTAGSTAVNTILTGTPTTVGSNNYTVSSGTFTALRDINVTITCDTQNSTTLSTQPTIYVNGSSTGMAGTTQSLANYNTSTSWTGIVPSGQTFYCRNDSSTATLGYVYVLSTNTINHQVYSASCGANCVDTFSFKVSSAGVVSNENVDLVNGNCAVTATSKYTCTWNTGIVTVPMNCTAFSDNYQTSWGTTTSSTFSYDIWNSSTTPQIGTATVVCHKTGADFTASRTIVGSFNEVVTTPGLTKPIIRSASISSCSADPCTVSSQHGNTWVTDVDRSSIGQFTATLNAGFTATPSCFGGSNSEQTLFNPTSATSLTINCRNGSGTLQNCAFNFTCHQGLTP